MNDKRVIDMRALASGGWGAGEGVGAALSSSKSPRELLLFENKKQTTTAAEGEELTKDEKKPRINTNSGVSPTLCKET